MLTLSQRLLSDASYFYQTQYEQCVLALYLNLSLINQEKISFSLCFRGRSCEHIIWKPPSPSSRKKNWQICEWLLPVARHNLLLQHGRIIEELLTRGIGGSRWRCKCESQHVGQTRGWCAALCHPHLLQRYWSAGHRAGLRNCQETQSRPHHERFLVKRAAPHATITTISS